MAGRLAPVSTKETIEVAVRVLGGVIADGQIVLVD